MKKSEFVSKAQFALLECLPATDQAVSHQKLHEGAEIAAECMTWGPEEPEVIWEAGWTTDATPRRILADGRIEYSPAKGHWLPLDCPTTRELARRLLAERAEKPTKDGGLAAGFGDLAEEIVRLRTDRNSWKDQANLWWARAVERGAELSRREREHVTDGGPCWCNPVTEKPDISSLPDGDKEAAYDLARWLEKKSKSRDLGGEIKEAEAARPEPRFARIVRCKNPNYWYAGSVGRIFEVMGETPEDFLAIPGPGLEGLVDREDCEIVPILRKWPDMES